MKYVVALVFFFNGRWRGQEAVDTDTADLDSGAAQGPLGTRAGDLAPRSLQGVLEKRWVSTALYSVQSVLPIMHVFTHAHPAVGCYTTDRSTQS